MKKTFITFLIFGLLAYTAFTVRVQSQSESQAQAQARVLAQAEAQLEAQVQSETNLSAEAKSESSTSTGSSYVKITSDKYLYPYSNIKQYDQFYLYNKHYNKFLDCARYGKPNTHEYLTFQDRTNVYSFQCMSGSWLGQSNNRVSLGDTPLGTQLWTISKYQGRSELYCLRNKANSQYLSMSSNRASMSQHCGATEVFLMYQDQSPKARNDQSTYRYWTPIHYGSYYLYNHHRSKFYNCNLQLVDKTTDSIQVRRTGGIITMFCNGKWIGEQNNVMVLNPGLVKQEQWELSRVERDRQVFCLRNLHSNRFFSLSTTSVHCQVPERIAFVSTTPEKMLPRYGIPFYIKNTRHDEYLTVDSNEIDATSGRKTRFIFYQRPGAWVLRAMVPGFGYVGKNSEINTVHTWDAATNRLLEMVIEHHPNHLDRMCVKAKHHNQRLRCENRIRWFQHYYTFSFNGRDGCHSEERMILES